MDVQEMDALVQEAAGLPLDQIFELHGERYYRRLERETLQSIVAGPRAAVVARSRSGSGRESSEPEWRESSRCSLTSKENPAGVRSRAMPCPMAPHNPETTSNKRSSTTLKVTSYSAATTW